MLKSCEKDEELMHRFDQEIQCGKSRDKGLKSVVDMLIEQTEAGIEEASQRYE